MDIVILGYTAHPYTRAVVGEFQRRNIKVKALVQRTHIDYPPELVLNNLMYESKTGVQLIRLLITPENIKRAIYNPGFAYNFLVNVLKKRNRREDVESSIEHSVELMTSNFKNITIRTVNDFNSKSSQRLLHQLSPDLIILGPAAQIIKGNILEIPNIGTLNAHQGLLPGYRGMDVLEYAILYGDKLGITVHFVNKGVDTGDIILRRYLNISQGTTLEKLWAQAIELSVESIADAVEMIERGDYETKIQDINDGRQYYPIHPILREIVGKKLYNYSQSNSENDK